MENAEQQLQTILGEKLSEDMIKGYLQALQNLNFSFDQWNKVEPIRKFDDPIEQLMHNIGYEIRNGA
jgi:hypothetical protein